ncbi:Lrp/AsnC family transcriptional regulator [uncultured Piscinibacter sp.]|uniref:siroheme decarboxylase subunit beta n=1 Tax=uncultured Piscinibacter sp. TaxID=1131835 RepID=UPI00261B3AED|nr:Lrp/AsnC family transcriptional regulator [uncultured Piscinibacter sp.]
MDTVALLNRWQHGFPLVTAPFAQIAAALGTGEAQVIAAFRAAQADGSLSRIGAVWAAGAGGAALLCAFAVPPQRLGEVAARVDALPGVNHNYEREHRFNLWFVITGPDAATLHARLDALQADTGLAVLRLPMQRVYRIDLGFDLHGAAARAQVPPAEREVPRVDGAERPLAALVEQGVPLVERPYAEWAACLGEDEGQVLRTIARWLDQGTLRRFGVVVRHHELGFDQNAMTVFDVPDDAVDDCGAALARQHGVTLCYRRARAEGWPYNLYCMVHGREREAVRALIDAATHAAGLASTPRQTLFSRRRFKQQGASYFRAAPNEAAHVLA